MKKNNKLLFYLINFFVVIIISGLTIYKIIDENGFDAIQGLQILSWLSIVVLVIFFVINYYFEGLVISISINNCGEQFNCLQGMAINSVGALFSAITPLKMGYLPGIAYVYSKFKIKMNTLIESMAKTSFSYQLVCLLFSIITFIICLNYNYNVIIGSLKLNLLLVAIIGLIYNSVLMIGYFVLVFSPKLHNFILKIISIILFKLKRVKDKDEYYEAQKIKMEKIRNQIKLFFKNKKEFVTLFVIYVIKVIFFNSLPYLIYVLLTNSFSVEVWLYSLILYNLITYIANIIPIPGASGASELVFTAIYALILDKNMLTTTMLVWRTFSYFLNIIVGFVVFIFVINCKKKTNQ